MTPPHPGPALVVPAGEAEEIPLAETLTAEVIAARVTSMASPSPRRRISARGRRRAMIPNGS